MNFAILGRNKNLKEGEARNPVFDGDWKDIYNYFSTKGLIVHDGTCWFVTRNSYPYTYTKNHLVLRKKSVDFIKTRINPGFASTEFNTIVKGTYGDYMIVRNEKEAMSVPQVEHWHIIDPDRVQHLFF